MSELAFNVNGERFDVPESAEYWRVRRFKPSGRGTPEVVFDADGLPLVIPIDTDIHEFRQLVEMRPGRYRLDAIDGEQRACQDAAAAYVQLAEPGEADGADESAAGSSGRQEDLIRDLVRVNAEMVKSITDKFATVMESAASLIRAADGAGMPARQPAVIPPVKEPESDDEEDDDEDDEPRNAGGFDLGAFLTQMMPMFQMVMAQRNQRKETSGTARNAAPADDDEEDDEDQVSRSDDDDGDVAEAAGEQAAASGETGGREPKRTGPGSEAGASHGQTTVRVPSPEEMAHFLAIQDALTPEEAQLAQAVAGELKPEEINAWIVQLSKLSVEEAVALIRETIRKTSASAGKGGVS